MSFSSVVNSIADRIGGYRSKFNSAIILAGGSGTRAGGTTTKQLALLCGIPVIVHTVNVFEECDFINEIIIVAKADEVGLYDDFAKQYGWKKISAVVVGGDSRQRSVLNGFRRISDKSEYVYIHDGARCLITKEMIASVGHAACVHGAAIAAQRATDTVKVKEGRMIKTVDRDTVWLAQTPQVFKTEMYRAAAFSAVKSKISVTDDASLCEALGFTVAPVDCSSQNVKITRPYDFYIAEAILKFRESEAENGDK